MRRVEIVIKPMKPPGICIHPAQHLASWCGDEIRLDWSACQQETRILLTKSCRFMFMTLGAPLLWRASETVQTEAVGVTLAQRTGREAVGAFRK